MTFWYMWTFLSLKWGPLANMTAAAIMTIAHVTLPYYAKRLCPSCVFHFDLALAATP